jgi:hypothetical protein
MASSVIFAWHFAICVGLKNKGKGLQLYITKRIQYLNHGHQRTNTIEAPSTNILGKHLTGLFKIANSFSLQAITNENHNVQNSRGRN